MEADLTAYPAGQTYTVDIGDGYQAILRRHPEFLFWCGYIRLRAGHPYIGKHYDEFRLKPFTVELTYSDGDTFGFDHGKTWDIWPRGQNPVVVAEGPYHDILQEIQSVRAYSGYHDVLREIIALKTAFVAAAPNGEELNAFCRNAIATGPVSSGLLLVIMGNTADKDAAMSSPPPLDTARVYLTRCGQERVLFHDAEGRFWDILYKVAERKLLSVQPWDGPEPSSLLDTTFCV